MNTFATTDFASICQSAWPDAMRQLGASYVEVSNNLCIHKVSACIAGSWCEVVDAGGQIDQYINGRNIYVPNACDIDQWFSELYAYVRNESDYVPELPCPARNRTEAVNALRQTGWACPESGADLVKWVV